MRSRHVADKQARLERLRNHVQCSLFTSLVQIAARSKGVKPSSITCPFKVVAGCHWQLIVA